MHEALILARFVHYAAVIAVFGGSAFRIYALKRDEPGTRSAVVIFEAWLGRLTLIGAVSALFSALALLCATAGTMAGSAAAALDGETIGTVLLETDFGQVWQGRLLLAAVLAVACCWPAMRRRSGLIAALAGLLLASLALVGHAGMNQGITKVGHEVNDGLHLLAAGVWLGGLLPLAWLLNRARGPSEVNWRSLARKALPPFSEMGYFTVAALALTGAVNALLLVGSVGALLDTPYGRVLGLKILLFLIMVAFALINRYRLGPRLAAGSPARYGRLCASVLIEQMLGLAIIAMASLLGTWPPAINAPVSAG